MITNIKSPDAEGGRRSLNKRTALVLLSIALAFFAGVDREILVAQRRLK